jgi:hypothetical protein
LPPKVSNSLFSVLKKKSAQALSQQFPHPPAAVPPVMPQPQFPDMA